MNVFDLQAQAGLQTYIKTTKTIAMTVAAYFMSYVPAIIYAMVGKTRKITPVDSWFAFVAWNAIFFSSVVNPVIFFVRASRFRSALKQFLKDPLGSSDFKEKPTVSSLGKQAAEKRKLARVAIKTNGDKKTRGRLEKYHGDRRNGIIALSVEALPAHLIVVGARESTFVEVEGLGSISAALSGPVIPATESRENWAKKTKGAMAEKLRKGSEVAKESGNKDGFKKSGLENDSGRGMNFTFRANIHLRGMSIPEETRRQEVGKGDMSGESESEDESRTEKHPDRVTKNMMILEGSSERTKAKTEDKYEDVSRKRGYEKESGKGKCDVITPVSG